MPLDFDLCNISGGGGGGGEGKNSLLGSSLGLQPGEVAMASDEGSAGGAPPPLPPPPLTKE